MQRAYLLMFISTTSFAFMGAIVKALPHIPAMELVLFRGIIIFIFCTAHLFRKNINIFGNQRKLLVLRGVAGLLGLYFTFECLQRLTLGVAATVLQTAPLFTALIAVIFLKERLNRLQVAGLLLAFIGVSFLKEGRFSELNGGFLIGILGAFFAAIAYNIIKVIGNRDHHFVVMLYFTYVMIPFAGVYCLWHWVQPSLVEWLYVGVFGLCAFSGQYFLTASYTAGQASRVAVINYFGPIVSTLLGYFMFGEIPTLSMILGAICIIGGAFLVTLLRSQ